MNIRINEVRINEVWLYNEKVLKYRIYRVICALKEKTQLYARKQWNKFDMQFF